MLKSKEHYEELLRIWFPKSPLCEMCKAEIATSFSYFRPRRRKTQRESEEALAEEAAKYEPSMRTLADIRGMLDPGLPGAARDETIGQWFFCGDCTSEKETYFVYIEQLFGSPASTVDYLAHLNEKVWAQDSWQSFMDMLYRFREATGSFGAM